jgi:uncharacterized SAM-binding protein YcdF (DUF218 family)
VIRDLARLAAVAAVGLLLVTAYAVARIWQQADVDESRRAGAIVVLGAAQYDGRPSQVFRARLDHATRLYLDGIAPYLVVTGGKQPGDRTTEADVARQYAISVGVPRDRILVEDGSRSTLQSIRAVRTILRAHRIDDAVFVSDPTHMLRVLKMADDAGIRSYGSPTRTSPLEGDRSSRWAATLHELAGLAFYLLAGGAPENDVAGKDFGAGPLGASVNQPYTSKNPTREPGPGPW